MKVTSFHFMPYRDLPDDVETRYRSVWVDAPWSELGDARKAGDFFNQSIDELMLAAELGFDGLGTNEHHQNPYGFMCNPNLFGSILARLTRERGLDVALVQLGATLAATSPPTRIAEEYAVLDCLSDGRLIAGVPVGIGADAAMSYGVPPIVQRARWREGIELMLRAWTDPEVFAWNGEHYQLRSVNLWPRPVQTPHPPLLVPGAHSASTWDMCHERDWPYAFLSYFGASAAESAMDGFWARADAHGRDRNPYRASFLQLVGVADTDEQAEALYGPHLEYFYKKLLHFPPPYFTPPGYVEYAESARRLQGDARVAAAGSQGAHRARHDRPRLRGRGQPGDRARPAGGDRTPPRRGPSPGDHAVRLHAPRPRRGEHPAHGVGRPAAPADALGRRGLGIEVVADRRVGEGRGMTVRTVPLRHCDFEAKVRVAGDGPPLVYLHPAAGPGWDPFLDALAERHTVYAPDHPGTGETARDAIHRVPGLWDLVLIYDELLDALGLDTVPLVGASFGGMVACEVAAHRRTAISRLVLLDPIGLWRDDAPVAQYMTMTPDELPGVLFHDPSGPAAQAALAMPDSADELAVAMADAVWAMGATGKFVWPIPDKGLARRLHRVTAPALVVWGEHDRLVSPVYAEEFAARLADARVEIVPDAGHVPQVERLDVVAPLVLDFLAA